MVAVTPARVRRTVLQRALLLPLSCPGSGTGVAQAAANARLEAALQDTGFAARSDT
jgi:hypothetical protein